MVNDLGGAVDGAGGGNAMADKVVAEIREVGGEVSLTELRGKGAPPG